MKHDPVGEIIPLCYEVRIGKDSIAFLYEPVACHSYNIITIGGQKIKIATIDTMLSFYLAFLYTNRPYYQEFLDRMLCIAKFLFDVQQKNRLQQKGLLKRFSILCYGHQPTVEEMRSQKAEMFQQLKDKRNTKEYEEWFLNYRPDQYQEKIQEKNREKVQEKNQENKNKKTQKKRKIINLFNKNKKTKKSFFWNKKIKNKKKKL